MNAIPADVWRGYESTIYRANVDDEDIRIVQGQMNERLDQALDARAMTAWA